MVADGHPVCRAPQGGDHLRGRGKRFLGIDDPGVLLQRGDEAGKCLGVSQGDCRAGKAQRSLDVSPVEAREIFPPKDLGEPFDGEEEVAALGGNPALAVWGEGAPGDDPVDMDVVLERLPPGMEHQGQAEFPAEPLGVPPERLQGGRGALEEEAVEELGIALGQGLRACGRVRTQWK